MRRMILALTFSCLLLFLAAPIQAAPCTEQGCKGPSYSACDQKAAPGSDDHVGPFLCDISSNCYNTGDCSLADIMTVVNNVGLFILGIIGSLVLLMYVIGGFMLMTSGGTIAKEGSKGGNRRTKGKQMIVGSTIGLIIVFAAFAGLQTIESVLKQGDVSGSNTQSCAGKTDGQSCGKNMICQSSICETICDVYKEDTPGDWGCVDKNSSSEPDKCEKNLCPGGANIQCCPK